MLRQIAIGAGMVFATTAIHAGFMVVAMLAHRGLESRGKGFSRIYGGC
jgi:hypothetical protein